MRNLIYEIRNNINKNIKKKFARNSQNDVTLRTSIVEKYAPDNSCTKTFPVYLVTEARHEQINVLGTFREEIKGSIAMIFAQKRIQYYYLLLLFNTFRISAVGKFHGLQCHPSKCISIGAEQHPTLFTKWRVFQVISVHLLFAMACALYGTYLHCLAG